MIARPYANLLPERFRRPLNLAMLVLIACYMISLALEYFTAIPAPWVAKLSNLFLFMLGLNYLAWPNDHGVSPLASRAIGGLLVGVLLLSLITYIIRHY
ncbi:MAG: hypothetical protein ABIS51_17505 [Sphingomonas sp.]